MSVIEKIKDIIGLELEEDLDADITEEEIKKASEKIERKTIDQRNNAISSNSNKVTPLNRINVTDKTGTFKMVIIDPTSFDECPKLVDNLKSRKPIIINLEALDSELARKMFDFLSGATYALNGNVQKITNNIFIFAPENVDIMASVEHKGIDFSNNNKNIWG